MNKIIVSIAVVLLVVSVATSFTVVNKVHELTGGSFLTGAAVSSTTGQTNVTVTATTSITLGIQQINFGSGRVNSSCNLCSMDSEGTVLNGYANGSNTGGLASYPQTAERNCCVSFNIDDNGFLIENTGNVNVSVGYTCSGNCTRQLFVGGSIPSGGIGLGNGLDIRVTSNNLRNIQNAGEVGLNDTANSCVGGGLYYRDSMWNITNESAYQSGMTNGVHFGGSFNGVYVALSSRGHWLCGNYTHIPLRPYNDRDAGVLDINVTINNDAPGTGVGSAFTLTFNATSQ